MGSIAAIIEHFKTHWEKPFEPQLVERICAEVGHQWRERCLTPWLTLGAFLLQILHGNTACAHVPHLTGQRFSATAYCQARKRLPLEVLERLLSHVAAMFRAATAGVERWRGHRVWVVDGSSFSMPDTTELKTHFGQPSGQRPGCGFPVASLLALFDTASGLLTEVRARPHRVHDMSGVEQLHACLAPGDVLLGDRGFCSYAHLALLTMRGVLAMFRLHQRQLVSFRKGRPHARKVSKRKRKGQPTSRFVRKLSRYDQWVDYLKPSQRPRWMAAEVFATLPDMLRVREFRFWTHRPGYRTRCITVVTTLLDPQRYPLAELAGLYGQRWQVETDLKHLKITLGMDVLHTKTVEGVSKELAMFVLAYNLVRLTMLEAAHRQQVPVTRISFVDALRWLLSPASLDGSRPLVVNPFRPGRLEPRVRKRRPKEYPLMKRPRAALRKSLLLQGLGT